MQIRNYFQALRQAPDLWSCKKPLICGSGYESKAVGAICSTLWWNSVNYSWWEGHYSFQGYKRTRAPWFLRIISRLLPIQLNLNKLFGIKDLDMSLKVLGSKLRNLTLSFGLLKSLLIQKNKRSWTVPVAYLERWRRYHTKALIRLARNLWTDGTWMLLSLNKVASLSGNLYAVLLVDCGRGVI